MLAYRLTDGLSHGTTAVSQAAADRFIRWKAVPKHKCIAVPNAFDLAEYAPKPGRCALVRARVDGMASAATPPFVWLAAGRIAPAKDYPNLLHAFALVHASRPDTQLWIAGDGPQELLQSLRALALELELGDSVRWLGLRRDLPELLDAADAFVLSSAWEGMPLAVGEAMCMEKPVVATDVGGVGELLGDAGVLVPPRAPRALGGAMLALMGGPAEARQKIGRAARQRIKDSFRLEDRIVTWESLYAEALYGKNSS